MGLTQPPWRTPSPWKHQRRMPSQGPLREPTLRRTQCDAQCSRFWALPLSLVRMCFFAAPHQPCNPPGGEPVCCGCATGPQAGLPWLLRWWTYGVWNHFLTSLAPFGGLATSPLRSGRSPTLQSVEQNQKWPTCGRIGYITPAIWGVPNASECGTKSEVAHKPEHSEKNRQTTCDIERGARGAASTLPVSAHQNLLLKASCNLPHF